MRFKLLLAAILTLAACTEKGKPIQKHDPEMPEARRLQEPQTPIERAQAESFFALAKIVLSEKRIEDTRSMTDSGVRQDLIRFNEMLLALTDKDKAQSENAEIIKTYKKVLLTGCSEILDSCTGMRYFGLASNSSAVVKEFAKSAPQSEKLRFVTMALHLKNRLYDAELVEMLVANLDERSELARSILSTALTDGARRVQAPDDARRFLDSVHAWNLLARFNLDQPCKDALYSLIAKADYFHDSKGGSHPDFAKWVAEIRRNNDSVFKRFRDVDAQKTLIPEAVGVRALSESDSLNIVLDAVYLQKISTDSAVLIIKGMKRSDADVAAAVENYLRAQFLIALFDASKAAKEIMNAPVASERLILHTRQESGKVRQYFASFVQHSQDLRNLSGTLIAGANRERINSIFSTLDHTINMSATYPHMMVLFFKLSQNRFEVFLPISGRTLQSARLIQLLFEGAFEPVLPYSEDPNALNYYEMLHAYDMAIRTGLFDTMSVNVDDMIDDTLRRLLEKPGTLADTVFDRVTSRFETRTMFEAKTTCFEDERGTKFPRTIYFGDLRDSPYLGKLVNEVHNSTASPIGNGLFYPDVDFNEAYESLRLDLGTIHRMGEAMLTSYKNYLEQFRLPKDGLAGQALQAELARRTTKTRARIEQVRLKRAALLAKANTFYKDFGRCYFKLATKDHEIGDQILGYEREYLRYVHGLIARLRNPRLTQLERTEIEAAIRLSGMPSGFEGFDRISATGYGYNQIDYLVRMAKYLTEGLRLPNKALPPIAPHLTIQFGDAIKFDSNIVADANTYNFLDFSEDVEEFERTAMRAWMSPGKRYIYWSKTPVSNAGSVFKNLASMYRLDFELNGKSTVATPAEILSQMDSYLKFIRFSDLDRELLAVSKQYSRFDLIMFNKNFIATDLSGTRIFDVKTIYDSLFDLMNNEILGYDLDIKQGGEPGAAKVIGLAQREKMFDGGLRYYSTRTEVQRGITIVPYSAALDSKMDADIRRFVKSEYTAISEFNNSIIRHVRTFPNLPESARPRADIAIDLSITKPYSDAVAEIFPSRLRKFHQQTGGFFK